MKAYGYLNLILTLFALVIFGCTAWPKDYGRLKSLPKAESEVTIRNLIDKWEDFDIYYADLGSPFSLGIMFDPKSNDTALAGDMWKKITDKETLLKKLKWIKHDRMINEVIGPDGRFYGYLYYSYGHVTLKMIEDNKMYVFNLEQKGGS
ncbi:MAG: hypothetical protein R6W88_15560 [Desulfobacterales bacterium]